MRKRVLSALLYFTVLHVAATCNAESAIGETSKPQDSSVTDKIQVEQAKKDESLQVENRAKRKPLRTFFIDRRPYVDKNDSETKKTE